jgi:Fur family ferric uptake transcriptional regulator
MQRVTKQRTAVAAALATLDDFRSSQELHEYLRDQGESVGLTTVYRTLQAMAELGEVDVIVRDDGEAAYRRCSDDHHHHLVCRSCGATVEITGPTVEEWADAMAAKHGFRDVSHTLEIFGLCRACS